LKTVSANLATHLASETTTVATCWRIERTDGQVFLFTDHDESLTVNSEVYLHSTAYKRTAIQDAAGLNVDNLDVVGAFSAVSVVEEDLRAGLWDYAAFEVFIVNWADLTQGTMKQRKGRLGEVKAGRSEFTVELRGLMQNIQQVIGRLYGPSCNADLGDSRCGIVLGGSPTVWTVTGTITSVTSNRVFYDTSRTEVFDWFAGGKITWVTGLNAGLSMEVKTSNVGSPINGYIGLHLPMLKAVQVGDTYSMTPGCQKRFTEDCQGKFNNTANFRGFPHIPGTDEMITGGR